MAPTFETGPTLDGELQKALKSAEAERRKLEKANQESKIDPLTESLIFDRNIDEIESLLRDMNFPSESDQPREGRTRQHKINAVMFVFCDLDKFKPINDTYGHDVGDRALKFYSRRLNTALARPGDRVDRKSGDEFILVLPIDDPDVSEGALKNIEAGIRERINNGFDFYPSADKDVDPIHMSVSMGSDVIRKGEKKTLKELIAQADQRMYAEKQRSGKGR